MLRYVGMVYVGTGWFARLLWWSGFDAADCQHCLAYVSWANAELQRFASVYQRQVLDSANNTFLNIAQCTQVILDEFASVCATLGCSLWARLTKLSVPAQVLGLGPELFVLESQLRAASRTH
jgi:hypothetical protein